MGTTVIKDIKIVEVSPRDGLQNEKEIIPFDKKKSFIEKLMETGVDEIEVGSFVSPKWVPQMQDTDKLFFSILPKDGIKFSALVPNMKGLERVMELPPQHRPKKLAVFTASSDTFNLKNINCTVEESFDRIRPVVEFAKREGFEVRAYISVLFGARMREKFLQRKLCMFAKNLLRWELTKYLWEIP